MTASLGHDDAGSAHDTGEPSHGRAGIPVVSTFARLPVLTVAALVAGVHVVAATRPGRWYDEALMLAIGRHHLDWGSVDQPPVVPLLARLADAVAPGSQLVLATPAILATAGAVVLAALVARELGGDRRAQILAALAQATSRWAALTGHWLTPYSVEPVLWLAIGWLVVRWMRTRDDRLLLALGLVAGVGAQTKFQVMLFCAVLALSAAVLGPRELLRRPMLWLGATIAALIAAPTLLWQAAHGWPQLRLSASIAAQAVNYGGRPSVALGLLALAGLMGVALGVLGLVALWTMPAFRDHRFLGLAFVVLYLVFVLPPGRPNYLAGFHGLLVAFGVVWLQRRREAGHARWRWVAWPAAALSIVIVLPSLQQSLGQATPTVADAVVATTAQAYRALPPEQRSRTVVMGDTFIYSAYLDAADPPTGLPPAAGGSVSYGYFPAPDERRDSVLLVGTGVTLDLALRRLRPAFAEARAVATVVPAAPRALVGGGGVPTTVWLLSGRSLPWAQLWPTLRTV